MTPFDMYQEILRRQGPYRRGAVHPPLPPTRPDLRLGATYGCAWGLLAGHVAGLLLPWWLAGLPVYAATASAAFAWAGRGASRHAFLVALFWSGLSGAFASIWPVALLVAPVTSGLAVLALWTCSEPHALGGWLRGWRIGDAVVWMDDNTHDAYLKTMVGRIFVVAYVLAALASWGLS